MVARMWVSGCRGIEVQECARVSEYASVQVVWNKSGVSEWQDPGRRALNVEGYKCAGKAERRPSMW